jgi:hypothetical protein
MSHHWTLHYRFMPISKYDYFLTPRIINKKLVPTYDPIIPIRLSANHKMYHSVINCFVDSGAVYNLMPASIGESLGLNIKKGVKHTHMGIGDIGIVAYSHPVTLYIQGYKTKTDVHFSFDHKIPLLGRTGFFKYFKTVTFNEKELQVQFEY